ncbi:OmpH family outer membrane protein [Flavobacterium sp. TSSA_36]|jgi:Skp family chaperone for outer membrane proteins|uniref:OmpH family outer membrane protein n=1 Tax=Flavobacterium sp. TSSA_36 TaxID=3447669 RepID=UPI003F3D7F8F
MRKHILFIFLSLFIVENFVAQTKGPKIGYIDMEYILQNVTGYLEATNQLEIKAQNWRQEIEVKKSEIKKLKEALTIEKSLLTRALIEERETEINFLDTDLITLQQKRFGPNGDYISQKSSLSKPVQDQVFTVVQDIAEKQKFDFIFDKTSDFTMLFAAKRFDISDQVLRKINNSEKREQLSKKQLEAQLVKEKIQEALDENPELNERQLELEAKKAAKEKLLQDRIQLQEQKRKEFEENRRKLKEERDAKKNGTVSVPTQNNASTSLGTEKTTATAKEISTAIKSTAEIEKEKITTERAATAEAKKQEIANRKKELEEKRKKILEEREAQRKAKEEALKLKTKVN